MKIIKKGRIRNLTDDRKFECLSCGCEFIAQKGEYKYSLFGKYMGSQVYVAKCPNCNKFRSYSWDL